MEVAEVAIMEAFIQSKQELRVLEHEYGVLENSTHSTLPLTPFKISPSSLHNMHT
jgi:hypothetical protein